MREFDEKSITQAVIGRLAECEDPRFARLMTSLVTHLHDFVREVKLTEAEWFTAIQFLTDVGKACTDKRQEFILLSDTLGLSALVNGLHDETALEEGTHTSLLGPFYREASPTLAAGSQIAKHVKPGTECVLYGRVSDINGKPLADATVSVWQTSADGLYDIQENASAVDYRGVFTTDKDGLYVVRTVKPRGYSIPMDGPVGAMVSAQKRHGMRPAHIHFLVGSPGYRELVTALYLRDDPHLADDVVFGSSDDLAVDIAPNDPECPIKGVPSIRFDLKLSREGEADKTSGRVGSDPSAILRNETKVAAPAPAAS
jgi:hydroxyquinol 1,2-dioxygenase